MNVKYLYEAEKKKKEISCVFDSICTIKQGNRDVLPYISFINEQHKNRYMGPCKFLFLKIVTIRVALAIITNT